MKSWRILIYNLWLVLALINNLFSNHKKPRSICHPKLGIFCWSLLDKYSTNSSIIFRSGTESGYTVMGLQNNTVYKVKLRSQNKFGWSPFSQVFTFQTMDKHKLSLTLQEKPSNPILDSQGKDKCKIYCQRQNWMFSNRVSFERHFTFITKLNPIKNSFNLVTLP